MPGSKSRRRSSLHLLRFLGPGLQGKQPGHAIWARMTKSLTGSENRNKGFMTRLSSSKRRRPVTRHHTILSAIPVMGGMRYTAKTSHGLVKNSRGVVRSGITGHFIIFHESELDLCCYISTAHQKVWGSERSRRQMTGCGISGIEDDGWKWMDDGRRRREVDEVRRPAGKKRLTDVEYRKDRI